MKRYPEPHGQVTAYNRSTNPRHGVFRAVKWPGYGIQPVSGPLNPGTACSVP